MGWTITIAGGLSGCSSSGECDIPAAMVLKLLDEFPGIPSEDRKALLLRASCGEGFRLKIWATTFYLVPWMSLSTSEISQLFDALGWEEAQQMIVKGHEVRTRCERFLERLSPEDNRPDSGGDESVPEQVRHLLRIAMKAGDEGEIEFR